MSSRPFSMLTTMQRWPLAQRSLGRVGYTSSTCWMVQPAFPRWTIATTTQSSSTTISRQDRIGYLRSPEGTGTDHPRDLRDRLERSNDRREALKSGASDYVIKTVGEEYLVTLMENRFVRPFATAELSPCQGTGGARKFAWARSVPKFAGGGQSPCCQQPCLVALHSPAGHHSKDEEVRDALTRKRRPASPAIAGHAPQPL